MRYGIIVNPAAGKTDEDQKRRMIERVKHVLGGETLDAGWGTRSAEELMICARDLASRVDVLIVAGGDGTFSDIINAVDRNTVLSYIPMGSGNAWRKTLGLPGSMEVLAEQIRDGTERTIDLILCDGQKKAVFASMGLDGHILKERARLIEHGVTGFRAYSQSTMKSLFGGYRRRDLAVAIDGNRIEVAKALSVIITKTPYYGYAFEIAPGAEPDDGRLHVLMISTGLAGALYGIITSFLGGNRVGTHMTGHGVEVTAREEIDLQLDGNLAGAGTRFTFSVLPGELTVRS